jgi:hypothetical protein
MWAYRTAAELLGVTQTALHAALDRGETIASLVDACGLDVNRVTEAIVEAELADIDALARIAGFARADIVLFRHEMRDYLVALVTHGEHAAEATSGAVLTAA